MNIELEKKIAKLEIYLNSFCSDLKMFFPYIDTDISMVVKEQTSYDCLFYVHANLHRFSEYMIDPDGILEIISTMGFRKNQLYPFSFPPYVNFPRVPFTKEYFDYTFENFRLSFRRFKEVLKPQKKHITCVACNGAICRYLPLDEQSDIIDKIESNLNKK